MTEKVTTSKRGADMEEDYETENLGCDIESKSNVV